MPTTDASRVPKPTIEPLRSHLIGKPDQISKTTLIQITSENYLLKIYFTTDGTTPDAFQRHVGKREVTHKYKAPFALKPGMRTVKAIAYTRNGKYCSSVSERTFEVVSTDSALSNIGEENEDTSTVVSSTSSQQVSSDDRQSDSPGSTRYMERLNRHLDEDLVLGTELEFETPRSIREMLNGMETPRTEVTGRSSSRYYTEDEDLSTSDLERLRELEDERQRDLEGERRREMAIERIRSQEDYCSECDDHDTDTRTTITDFFVRPSGRSYNAPERRHQEIDIASRRENFSSLSPSRQRREEDYGITGVTPRLTHSTSGLYNKSSYTDSDRGYTSMSLGNQKDYRAQVDRELSEKLRSTQLYNSQPLSNQKYSSSIRPSYTISTYTPPVQQDECCIDCCKVPDVPCEECCRGPTYIPELVSRGRSRERSPVGILKRGRSLERDEYLRGIDNRRRSMSNERSWSRSRSRSRDRLHRRARSPSPSRRYDFDTQSDIVSYGGDTYRVVDDSRQRREVTFSDQEGKTRPSRRGRGRSREIVDKATLEEIDLALELFEDTKSKGPRDHRRKPKSRSRERERSAKALKNKKDTANLKKSTAAKGRSGPKPFASSSSSVSLSSSSEDERKDKKEETEKEKNDKDQEKEASDDSKNVQRKQTYQRKNKVDVQPDPMISEEQETGQDNTDPKKTGNKQAEGALNFFNDSGTQINFWGVSPDEIARRLQENPAMKSAVEQAVGYRNNQQQQQPSVTEEEEETESEVDNEVDHFFMTEARGRRRQVKAFTQAQAFCENTDDMDGPSSIGPGGGFVEKHEQQSQHSFFGKIKSFFTGKGNESKPIASYKPVDYAKVKKECLKKKKLWEDPDFPAEDSSLFSSQKPPMYPYEWKRPGEISDEPQMFVGGASRFDVKQGCLGDCWLLAAMASLASDKKLLSRVVPMDQHFDKEYSGIIRFQFWQYGEWIDVCVDDRLPTKAGKLVYIHSDDENEFWSPLLEKAYAKLCGSYENLSGGLTSEALTDFIGGVVEVFNFKEELPDNIFQILFKAHERGSLMGCSIDAEASQREQRLENGLIIGHAYSITDVKQVVGKKGEVNLLRVRNPWGNESEWNGAWSDSSKEWQSLNDKTKQKLGLVLNDDGEFWMSARDFTTYFQRVEICHQDRSGSGAWESTFKTGSWAKKANAGGCLNNPSTYWTNPQYRVTVTDMDDDDEEEVGTIIVGLMQKGRRRLRSSGGGNLTIGYDIFKVNSKSSETLDKKFFNKNNPVATSSFVNSRETTGRYRLTPGEYVIVPSTFEPGEEAEFMLRIYSEKEADLFESDTPTSVNTNVTAKSISAAHSAPPREKELGRKAETEFISAAGEDGEVDAYELLNILNSYFTKGFNFGEFNINSCRSMVSIRDVDSTGMLGLEEFKELWNDLTLWKDIFKKYDKDKSCAFNSFELREALKSAGYSVSNNTFKRMVNRYSDREGLVKFDDFVDCIVRLKTSFELYKKSEENDSASFSINQFMENMMST